MAEVSLASPRPVMSRDRVVFIALSVLLLVGVLVSLQIGRYGVSPGELLRVFREAFTGTLPEHDQAAAVLLNVRLPGSGWRSLLVLRSPPPERRFRDCSATRWSRRTSWVWPPVPASAPASESCCRSRAP